MSSYRVTSQHGTAARTRTRSFDTIEAAIAYGDSISPELDPTTIPNVNAPGCN